jgi:hypothetical protein
VEPKVAFSRILEEHKENCMLEMEKRKSCVESVTSILSPVFEMNKDITYSFDFVEVFKDKEQIQRKYIQMVKDAKHSLYTFNKGPYVCDTTGRLNEQLKEEAKLLKRKAICKNIYEDGELRSQDWLLKSVKSQSKLGQQARVVKNLPIKMMVFDEQKVFFPLLKPSSEASNINMIFIEHRELAIACKILFNFIWEQGKAIR